MTSPDTSIPQRFVQLSLALDRHTPGYVDAYFGPPEWKAQSISGGPRPLDELAQEAASLAAAVEQIKRSTVSGAITSAVMSRRCRPACACCWASLCRWPEK